MKLLLVIAGLFAAAFATGPPTPTCIDRCASCLEAAVQVNIPDIDLDVSISLLGLIKIRVGAVLDCTALGAYVRLATEKSYTEITSGDLINFQLELEVALAVDLTLNAGVTVWTALGIELGVGLCVLGYVDVVIDINIGGTYSVGGNPADCTITGVSCGGTRTAASDWLTSSGSTVVGSALTAGKTDILNVGFDSTLIKIDALLNGCLL